MKKGKESSLKGEHHKAKVITALGVAGVGVGAAGAAITWAHIRHKRHQQELQTYGPDEHGRTPEEMAAVLVSSDSDEALIPLARVAAQIHFATYNTNRMITATSLRERLPETTDYDQLDIAITTLSQSGLIKVDSVTQEDGSPLFTYSATEALDWAVMQGENYRALADAYNEMLQDGFANSGSF